MGSKKAPTLSPYQILGLPAPVDFNNPCPIFQQSLSQGMLCAATAFRGEEISTVG
jgi:hypothetical protein